MLILRLQVGRLAGGESVAKPTSSYPTCIAKESTMFAKKSVRVVFASLALALVAAIGVHPTTTTSSHNEAAIAAVARPAGIRWS